MAPNWVRSRIQPLTSMPAVQAYLREQGLAWPLPPGPIRSRSRSPRLPIDFDEYRAKYPPIERDPQPLPVRAALPPGCGLLNPKAYLATLEERDARRRSRIDESRAA